MPGPHVGVRSAAGPVPLFSRAPAAAASVLARNSRRNQASYYPEGRNGIRRESKSKVQSIPREHGLKITYGAGIVVCLVLGWFLQHIAVSAITRLQPES